MTRTSVSLAVVVLTVGSLLALRADHPRATAADPIRPAVIGGDENVSAVKNPAPAADDFPPDRILMVQITDAELGRLNLPELFKAEHPDIFAATGGPDDYAAYYGLCRWTIRPASGLDTAKRAGWLAPFAFVSQYGSKMRGATGWERLPGDAPRPEWLKAKK